MADVQWRHGSRFFSFLDWFPVLGVCGGVCVAPPPFCWSPAGCSSSFLAWISRWGLWGGLWVLPLPAKDGCFLSAPGLVPGRFFQKVFCCRAWRRSVCSGMTANDWQSWKGTVQRWPSELLTLLGLSYPSVASFSGQSSCLGTVKRPLGCWRIIAGWSLS